ncbi:MAG: tripartite tricarboxylate transporter substrate binding protein [Clostridia bacterium]|nr:tripartite tricarboxylate transporter substrate binding protein [Clostridia bacterium]
MKKLVCLVLAAMMLLSVAALASAEWKFERKITFVCPWGVGGGADGTIRPMANLLQDKLGVPCEVQNVEGGSGVNGVEYTLKQPADGYTFMLGTQSLYLQDMMGNISVDFKTEMQPIDVLVHSINFIVASKASMDKYGVSNWTELTKYIEEHPFEVSVAMLTATGVDGASLAQATDGLFLLELPYDSGSDANSALVGGHVDLYVCGYDEIAGLVESGNIVPMLALCENRLKVLPDLECSGEVGVNSFMAPWRAIFAKTGTPQEAIDALVAAVEECRQEATWQEFIKAAAYDERPVPTAEELPAFAQSEYKALRDYMVEQGTLVKDYDDLK